MDVKTKIDLAMAHQLPPQIKGVYYVSYLDLDDA
jgi:hypothetical protein